MENSLIQEQRDIFHHLQQIVDTDRSMRTAAQQRRSKEEEEAKKELDSKKVYAERGLNELIQIRDQAISTVLRSEWKDNITGGTSQLRISDPTPIHFVDPNGNPITQPHASGNTDPTQVVYACRTAAMRAKEDIAAFLEKNPEPSSIASSSGWLTFVIVGILTFIMIGAAPTGAVAEILIAIVIFIGIRALIIEGRKRPLKDDYSTLIDSVNQAGSAYQAWLRPIEGRHQMRMIEARQQYERTTAELDRILPQKLAMLQPNFAKFLSNTGIWGMDWQHPSWSQWTLATTIQLASRIGTFLPINKILPPVPAFIGCPGNENLLFEVSGDARDDAINTIQSLMLRLLAMQPPGKVRFTLIDPMGLGQNVAIFMQLADLDEKLVSNRAWSETKHIEQQLTDLSEHMGYVIQKYLRGQYSTIEEYNLQAGEVAEPYRVLVVTGFPVKFSQEAVLRLVEIATNGPRCGVFTLVMLDTKQALPYDFNISDLERVSVVLV